MSGRKLFTLSPSLLSRFLNAQLLMATSGKARRINRTETWNTPARRILAFLGKTLASMKAWLSSDELTKAVYFIVVSEKLAKDSASTISAITHHKLKSGNPPAKADFHRLLLVMLDNLTAFANWV
ncbi:hypothetical protein CPB85DRAFT_649938 [Mucidula mucida]|nr:hypothetical protein CPB85DRAFT_649938 [Mucidula mucida]